MSNDISYNLIFTASKKVLLMQVKSYLEDKKSRWDNRGEKTAAELLKETGLQNAAEVVCWGFDFGKIQQSGDSFSVEVTSWANENSLGNIWISGSEGELHFLLEKFPELEISGSFKGEFGRGAVYGSELDYESWNDDEDEDSQDDEDSDDDEESQELTFIELDPELWEAARSKNQAMASVLGPENAPGKEIEVALPKDVAMRFCSIPAGSFTMGSPEDEEGRFDEFEKQVEVTLSQPFWLAKTQVTQVQFEAIVGSNPSNFKGANLPVETVSWEDAQAYIAKLNEKGGLPEGWKFALPTEALWEYACRAGEKGPYSGGSLDEMGWYQDNSELETHEVGLKKANTWGLHDMHGNVNEWCADWQDDALKGGNDPTGPTSGYERVSRGGSFDDRAENCRAANRAWLPPDDRYDSFGFRIAIVQSK
jgi:formylglycine-generating enzyme required for sulfatase activity